MARKNIGELAQREELDDQAVDYIRHVTRIVEKDCE
jgi:hypothetical protein